MRKQKPKLKRAAPGKPNRGKSADGVVRSYGGFVPPFLLRSSFVQTALGSRPWGPQVKAGTLLHAGSERILLNVGEGITLEGYFNPAFSPARDFHGVAKKNRRTPKAGRKETPLYILLHGWEGSATSAYILRSAAFLHDKGFDVFRLNLRDHGDTHHLNAGAFNGSLIREVYEGVRQAALRSGGPVYVAGFSLGGNFALRVALRHSLIREKIPRLAHVVAVSPAINPHDSTLLMDAHAFYGRYFRRKWIQSLRRKERAFPEKYSVDEVLKSKTVMAMTDYVIPRYTEFSNAIEYFKTYTLLDLRKVKIPTTILTSKDDPIIHWGDFEQIPGGSVLAIRMEDYGGHNGFVKNLKFETLYCDVFADVVRRASRTQR